MPPELKNVVKQQGVSLLWTVGKIGVGALIAWQGIMWQVSTQLSRQQAFNTASVTDRAAIRDQMNRLTAAIDGREGLQAQVARMQGTLDGIAQQLDRLERNAR